ncbi:hypothetical protein [Wolinella succinogenes]|uniref:hypothetical protein n=1 Tax=Wolinella succinogenes TaxID=844 RepID=UPI002FCC0650
MFNLASILVPLAVEVLKSYVSSSATSKDDKILEVVKTGAKYLADCPECSITDSQARFLDTQTIKKDSK